jgi:hypothetical protein
LEKIDLAIKTASKAAEIPIDEALQEKFITLENKINNHFYSLAAEGKIRYFTQT